MNDFNNDHAFYDRIGDHEKLLVVFNYYDQPLSIRSHYRFLEKIPCNKLFLHSGKNDWHQNGVPGVAKSFDDLIDFCRSIKSVFAEKKILYLGHSMGAFAALGCGIAARGDRVLVSVPEIDLCLPGSMSAKVLRTSDLTRQSIRDYILSNVDVPIYCVVGKQDNFDMSAALNLNAAGMTYLKALNCDHSTFPYLRDKGVLEALLRAFVEEGDISQIVGDL